MCEGSENLRGFRTQKCSILLSKKAARHFSQIFLLKKYENALKINKISAIYAKFWLTTKILLCPEQKPFIFPNHAPTTPINFNEVVFQDPRHRMLCLLPRLEFQCQGWNFNFKGQSVERQANSRGGPPPTWDTLLKLNPGLGTWKTPLKFRVFGTLICNCFIFPIFVKTTSQDVKRPWSGTLPISLR